MAICERTKTIYYTRCDICGNTGPGHELKGIAKQPAGWERLEWHNGLDLVHMDICPDCRHDPLAEAYRVRATGDALLRPTTEEEQEALNEMALSALEN